MKPQKKELNSKQQLIISLNRLLADTVILKLQAKQAHWNIKGPNFIAMHQLLDQTATIADSYTDMLAERAVQLGGLAIGSLDEISKYSQLKTYPAISTKIESYIKNISTSLKICVEDACSATDLAAESNDTITADLFTEVARSLDKQRWLLESNL